MVVLSSDSRLPGGGHDRKVRPDGLHSCGQWLRSLEERPIRIGRRFRAGGAESSGRMASKGYPNPKCMSEAGSAAAHAARDQPGEACRGDRPHLLAGAETRCSGVAVVDERVEGQELDRCRTPSGECDQARRHLPALETCTRPTVEPAPTDSMPPRASYRWRCFRLLRDEENPCLLMAKALRVPAA